MQASKQASKLLCSVAGCLACVGSSSPAVGTDAHNRLLGGQWSIVLCATAVLCKNYGLLQVCFATRLQHTRRLAEQFSTNHWGLLDIECFFHKCCVWSAVHTYWKSMHQQSNGKARCKLPSLLHKQLYLHLDKDTIIRPLLFNRKYHMKLTCNLRQHSRTAQAQNVVQVLLACIMLHSTKSLMISCNYKCSCRLHGKHAASCHVASVREPSS